VENISYVESRLSCIENLFEERVGRDLIYTVAHPARDIRERLRSRGEMAMDLRGDFAVARLWCFPWVCLRRPGSVQLVDYLLQLRLAEVIH
jgi:hypothetical protein